MGPELTRLTGLPGLPELTGLPRLTGLTELTGLAGLIQAGPQAACVGGHARRAIFFCIPLRQNRMKFLASESAYLLCSSGSPSSPGPGSPGSPSSPGPSSPNSPGSPRSWAHMGSHGMAALAPLGSKPLKIPSSASDTSPLKLNTFSLHICYFDPKIPKRQKNHKKIKMAQLGGSCWPPF